MKTEPDLENKLPSENSTVVTGYNISRRVPEPINEKNIAIYAGITA